MNNLAILPNQSQDQLLCNIKAEESVLGAIFIDPETINRVKDILPPEAFYVQAYKDIYKEVLKNHNQGCAVDLLTMMAYFESNKKLEKIGGTAKLMHLVDSIVSVVHVDCQAESIVDNWIRRQVIAKANEIQQMAYISLIGGANARTTSHFLEKIENTIKELTQSRHRKGIGEDMKTWEYS